MLDDHGYTPIVVKRRYLRQVCICVAEIAKVFMPYLSSQVWRTVSTVFGGPSAVVFDGICNNVIVHIAAHLVPGTDVVTVYEVRIWSQATGKNLVEGTSNAVYYHYDNREAWLDKMLDNVKD